MVLVDFDKIIFFFAIVFGIFSCLCLFALMGLASAAKKRSTMVKVFVFFVLLVLFSLFLAYKYPDAVVGWIK